EVGDGEDDAGEAVEAEALPRKCFRIDPRTICFLYRVPDNIIMPGIHRIRKGYLLVSTYYFPVRCATPFAALAGFFANLERYFVPVWWVILFSNRHGIESWKSE